MNFGPVIEVLVGLIFMFFVFSVLSSGINEYISRALQKRVDFLAAGISQLLGERGGAERSKHLEAFWKHPLVTQLGQSLEGLELGRINRAWRTFADAVTRLAARPFVSRVGRAARLRRQLAEELADVQDANLRRLPSYIPTAIFVAVVEDIIKDDRPQADTPLGTSLAAVDHENPEKRLANYGRWFDDQMDRVSGWYKRESKSILFLIGLIVVVAMNVDTLAVARTLWKEPTTRTFVNNAVEAQLAASAPTTAPPAAQPGGPSTTTASVATPTLAVVCKKAAGTTATTATTTPADAIQSTLDCATALPIGWRISDQCFKDATSPPTTCSGLGDRVAAIYWNLLQRPGAALLKLIGLLITAAALSFGAPFWFEFLNKFANLRGAGAKPSDTSGSGAKTK